MEHKKHKRDKKSGAFLVLFVVPSILVDQNFVPVHWPWMFPCAKLPLPVTLPFP